MQIENMQPSFTENKRPSFFPLLLMLGAIIAFAGACSTAKVNVMPGEKGVHKVMVRDIERDDAEEEAVEGAKEYCEKQGKQAVFVKNDTKYTGKMDEETRTTVRNVSKVATIVGSGMGVGGVAAGRGGVATPGAVLGTAGMVGYGMTSNRDYQVEATFKCQ